MVKNPALNGIFTKALVESFRRVMHRVMKRAVLPLIVFTTTQAASAACDGVLKHFNIYEKGQKIGSGQLRDFVADPRKTRAGRGLVLPTTAGENAVDRLWARELCKRGLSSQLLVSWPETKYDLLDPRLHNEFVKLVQAAADSMLGDDPTPVVLVGTSLGGVAASSLIAVEPRIVAAALIATGSDVHEIIAHSDHKKARAQREGMMKKYGLKTIEEFEEFLDDNIDVDPSDLLPVATHDLPETPHVIATQDKTVPTLNQKKLVGLYPQPTVFRLKGNHFGTIVNTGLHHKRKVIDYLLERLPN